MEFDLILEIYYTLLYSIRPEIMAPGLCSESNDTGIFPFSSVASGWKKGGGKMNFMYIKGPMEYMVCCEGYTKVGLFYKIPLLTPPPSLARVSQKVGSPIPLALYNFFCGRQSKVTSSFNKLCFVCRTGVIGRMSRLMRWTAR